MTGLCGLHYLHEVLTRVVLRNVCCRFANSPKQRRRECDAGDTAVRHGQMVMRPGSAGGPRCRVARGGMTTAGVLALDYVADPNDALFHWFVLSLLVLLTAVASVWSVSRLVMLPAARPRLIVPFDDEGRLLTIPSIWRNPIWRDNFEFAATLCVCGFGGVSDDQGRWFMVFDPDMPFILANATEHQGEVSGVWTFCSRGGRFGIRLLRAGLTKGGA